ncbi:MAG: NAD(P)-dependent oxidoreductase [Bacteroidales bacterium]|nr:NAD(P)-dependent oxidoreductase [Bacteroidales bacterium]
MKKFSVTANLTKGEISMELGWIGTGNMGLRMAQRLEQAGHSLIVYNRTSAKAQSLLTGGKACLAGSPAEVSERSDMIFTSVTDSEALFQMLCGENGVLSAARPGQIIVDMSTIGAEDSRRFQKAAETQGAFFLSAPVIGSMFMAEKGLLHILVSGDPSAWSVAKPYLEKIGRTCTYLGGDTQARQMKIAVNMLICSYFTIYSEVLLIGEGLGFSWGDLNRVLEESLGASPMLSDKGSTYKERIWESGTALTSTAMKDLGLALESARSLRLSFPLTAAVRQYDIWMYGSREYAGYSSFGTIGILENLCGISPAESTEVTGEQKTLAERILESLLVGATTLLASEAMQLCRNSGIQENVAKELLGTCHGATAYIKSVCGNGTEKSEVFTISRVLSDFREALTGVAKDCGLFVPILAAAEQELYLLTDNCKPESELKILLSD